MRPVWHDLLLGIRSLRKAPATAIITSFTLALGIGLCTIAFSLVYGVFLRGLDVPRPDRLSLIYRTNPAREVDWAAVPVHDFYDWRAQQTPFEGLARFSTRAGNVPGTRGARRLHGPLRSPHLFARPPRRPLPGPPP